jgi:hypothetical protein
MKPARPRTPLPLKGMLFALSLASMATQAGSAPLPLGAAQAPRAAQAIAVSVPLPGGLEPPAAIATLLRGPPVSGSWALLFAGLTGILAIGRRRLSALGSLSFDPQRLRRR